MTVGELAGPILARDLCESGVRLQTGPFVFHLQTPIPSLVEDVQFLYGDFPVEGEDGVADFHVRIAPPFGLRRWVRPQAIFSLDGDVPFEPFPLDLALPMLEWSLNWCVATHAFQYVMVHAAVVERGGRAIVLPGEPGAGKSTLCAAMIHRGWRLLSDEFALLRAGGRLVPWPRPVSLKGASIDVIRAFAPEVSISRPVPDTVKGTIAHMRPPTASARRAGETAAPAVVVFPRYRAGAATTLTPLPRSGAFFKLADQSHNYAVLGTQGFETLAGIIDTCEAFDFTYSDLEEAVRLLASLVPEPVGPSGPS